jgi:uncharacterized membrane protein YphA (DoxX/SURF4 family)
MHLSHQHKKNIATFCCSILVLVFAYSGGSKVWDHQNFTAQLGIFFSESPAAFFAWAVPVAELLTAIGLVIQPARLKACYASLFLLISFTVYIIYLLLTASSLPCSCGGIIAALSWQQHLVLNALLILITIATIKFNSNYKAITNH